jgi:mycothiol synthase
VELSVCLTDDDYQAWREVRMEVISSERCDTVAELRAQDSPTRLMILARVGDEVVGSGMSDRSSSAGGVFVAPRVRPEHRRKGVGSALFHALAQHAAGLGLPQVRSMVDDPGSLAFAEHFGFAEVDRQVEQVRAVADEPTPGGLAEGVDVVTLDERPGLWAASYAAFGTQVLADFALFEPLEISEDQWNRSWAGDPMFLALHGGDVIGCAGLDRDPDRPERGENALTAVRRDWRGHGIAAHLKRRTLRWAAENGITELYTWTQAGNTPMLTLNQRLGYTIRQTSITVSRPLPV